MTTTKQVKGVLFGSEYCMRCTSLGCQKQQKSGKGYVLITFSGNTHLGLVNLSNLKLLVYGEISS